MHKKVVDRTKKFLKETILCFKEKEIGCINNLFVNVYSLFIYGVSSINIDFQLKVSTIVKQKSSFI